MMNKFRDWLDKYSLIIGIVLLVGLIAGGISLTFLKTSAKAETSSDIVVEIAGAVVNPGVYHFTSGAIVEDVLVKAGGLKPEANLELIAKIINRAATLSDHSKLYFPFDTENVGAVSINTSPTVSSSSSADSNTGQLVNINTADAGRLDTLPGIGPVYAGRIVDYRQKNGSFTKLTDLMKVSGISLSTYNKLKDKITL